MTQRCELFFKLQFTEVMINQNKVEVMELKEPGSWAGFRLGDFACHQALLQVISSNNAFTFCSRKY